MSHTEEYDVKLVMFHFIRIYFEKTFKQDVPMAIKYIILLYSKRCIGCKLLSLSEDISLFALLNKRINDCVIKNFKLLYRASDNQFSACSFHRKCVGLDKWRQIVIIKSNHGTIFGGYISKDWTREPCNRDFTDDECAFIYLVTSDKKQFDEQCPMYFPIKSSRTAIGHDYGCGPIFGERDIYIADKCNEKGEYIIENLCYDDDVHYYSKNYTCFKSYDADGQRIVLCGGQENWDGYYDYEEEEWNPYGLDGAFDVIDYEVFQVINN